MTHLDTPIGADLLVVPKRAAEIRGMATTDFVVAVVQEAAQCTIAETAVVRLSPTDSDRFAEPIPYPPSPALERAFTPAITSDSGATDRLRVTPSHNLFVVRPLFLLSQPAISLPQKRPTSRLDSSSWPITAKRRFRSTNSIKSLCAGS
jgi:uncharacterized protein (DUF1778 family)